MLVIFDDGRGRFGPLTDRRPVFELRTGALTTRQRLEAEVGRPAEGVIVPPRLVGVLAQRLAGVAVNPGAGAFTGETLFVNGRYPGTSEGSGTSGGGGGGVDLAGLGTGEALVDAEGAVVAARLEPGGAGAFAQSLALPGSVDRQTLGADPLLRRPWDMLTRLGRLIAGDALASDTPDYQREAHTGIRVLGEHPVKIDPTARVRPGVVLLAEDGPIWIGAHATVGVGCAIEGPAAIGEHSELNAHTNLRPEVALGPCCKVGGELRNATIHSYSNKAHTGYLGNALVGQWCNLGADTNISNLKNTYGPVRVQLDPGAAPEDTGRCQQGPILGDFVRTAIGSRLLTGSVIGTGVMLATAGFAPKFIPGFRFITDDHAGRVSNQPHEIDKLVRTARAMLGRRGLTWSEAEAALLRELGRRADQ